MTRDELEFSLSQYHDGTLGPVEQAALDEVLASSAEAREVLAEYQRLDALVKRAPAMPALDWDRLASHISSAVADAEAPAVKTYRIGNWAKWTGGLVAAAAAVAIAVSVSLRNNPAAPMFDGPARIEIAVHPGGATSGTSTVNVNVGSAIPAVASVQIDVGPSAEVARSGWPYDDMSYLGRAPRVVIAITPDPAQDGGSSAPF